MNTHNRHRFPPDIISYAVWLYYRFNLSHRDTEESIFLTLFLNGVGRLTERFNGFDVYLATKRIFDIRRRAL